MNSLETSLHILVNTECTFLLGILTVPGHLDLRNFARSSWIKDLPNHVCYIFLYDKSNYIPENETYDSLSLNSKFEGYAVRFGEKLYNFYSCVQNNKIFSNVRYVVKMDDDVVLCSRQLFYFFNHAYINLKTYAGWFHNIGEPNISYHKRADEGFVMLGLDLVARIASKDYCYHNNQKICDSFGQLFDTNYGGTSLGIWLSEINDVDVFPLNNILKHSNANKGLKTEDTLIYHPTKTVNKAKKIYNNCQSLK